MHGRVTLNRERAKELAPVIQAHGEGKMIECRADDFDEWSDAGEDPSWFDALEYRIKPEPREFWVSEGTPYYLTKEEIERVGRVRRGFIHVREVVDE